MLTFRRQCHGNGHVGRIAIQNASSPHPLELAIGREQAMGIFVRPASQLRVWALTSSAVQSIACATALRFARRPGPPARDGFLLTVRDASHLPGFLDPDRSVHGSGRPGPRAIADFDRRLSAPRRPLNCQKGASAGAASLCRAGQARLAQGGMEPPCTSQPHERQNHDESSHRGLGKQNAAHEPPGR